MKRMKPAEFIHRLSFAVAVVIYVVGMVSALRQHPALLSSLVAHPLRTSNIILLGALSAIPIALWFVCGWVAKHLAGNREFE
jgi:hypothetical protein